MAAQLIGEDAHKAKKIVTLHTAREMVISASFGVKAIILDSSPNLFFELAISVAFDGLIY